MPRRKNGEGTLDQHQSAPAIDRSRVSGLMDEIRRLREAGYDFVERAGKLRLPLVLTNRSDFDHAFHCAAAELSVTYSRNQRGLQLLLEAHFDRRTIADHFRDPQGKLDVLHKVNFKTSAKKKIIWIAYPWYDSSIYMALARTTQTYNLDIREYEFLAGRYRYFRHYPVSSSTFYVMDGYMQWQVDRQNNAIIFGDSSRVYRDQDIFEHRGFVLPVAGGNISLVGFREGVVRLGIVHHSGRNVLNGILTTSTRQAGRPFSSKFMMVKEGMSEYFDLDIPLLDHARFDPHSPQYKQVESVLWKLNEGTSFGDVGFVWGGPSYEF